jgi:antitoxin component of MazEF toxin-antitoxin module
MGERPMIKKLSKHGNSLALVIDRPILDLLKIDEETSLDISTDGQSLLISPVQDTTRKKRLAAALERGHNRYEKTFRRLAE